jgi:hypothetical protein
MTGATFELLSKSLLELVLWAGGFWLIWSTYGWHMTVGLFLIVWADNMMMKSYLQKRFHL